MFGEGCGHNVDKVDRPQVVNGVLPEPVESEVVWLHAQYAGGLLRFASSLTCDEENARDAVQEVFLRYLLERSYGKNIQNPRGWLYQVLRNYLRDRRRAASAQTEVAADNLDFHADSSHSPETLLEREEMVSRIASALSGRERECLELRAEGLSYEEIGVAMDVRSGTVGVLLSRALEKIRRLRQEGAVSLLWLRPPI